MPEVPCYGIIPARYESTRFPGKPLADILGKPMFWHVYTRAMRSDALHAVYLATDDERIRRAAAKLGVPVVMTAKEHASGTDRILEAAEILDLDRDSVLINIQGDEPALEPNLLDRLVEPFEQNEVMVTTLARKITAREALSPDRVKVAWSTASGNALYFSRSRIPYSAGNEDFWGHIGLYGYRFEALQTFSRLGPSPLEQRERLEQLRLLEAGIPIRVVPTTHQSVGVDRPEDLEIVKKLIQENE